MSRLFPVHRFRDREGVPQPVHVGIAAKPAQRHGLRSGECAFGLAVFVGWLLLFGAGILVDTAPYRRAISLTGAEALDREARPPAAELASEAPPPVAAVIPPETVAAPDLLVAWLIVLTCFVPLNLAWLCVAASGLGAFGNLANLGDDAGGDRSSDTTNPYTSALLRGFFVYLFMMSGLLVFDDAPFSNSGPGQYIRLAGFLSLFSFVVSYQPRFFGALILTAFQRIQVRGGESTAQARTDADTVRASVDVDKGTVDVSVAKHSAQTSIPTNQE